MTHQYRCETCSYYLKYAVACDKIKERLIVGAEEWIDKVGCASHSSATNCREKQILDAVKERLDDIISGELPCGEDDNSLSTILAIRVHIETLEKYPKRDGVG